MTEIRIRADGSLGASRSNRVSVPWYILAYSFVYPAVLNSRISKIKTIAPEIPDSSTTYRSPGRSSLAVATMDSYRMSQQFRAQGQVNGGKSKQQQQNDPDAFMRLVSRTNVRIHIL